MHAGGEGVLRVPLACPTHDSDRTKTQILKPYIFNGSKQYPCLLFSANSPSITHLFDGRSTRARKEAGSPSPLPRGRTKAAARTRCRGRERTRRIDAVAKTGPLPFFNSTVCLNER